MSEKVLISGNHAMMEAAVRNGCRFFAGYPITPQNAAPEYMSVRMPEAGGVFIQGESEIASISMVYGATASGVRSMTSTSGPGLALMSETLAHFVQDLPVVVIDAARQGPGGSGVNAAQQDYFYTTKALCPGGVRFFVMAPSNVQELASMTYEAFDIADKYWKPVLILTDALVVNTIESVEFPDMRDLSTLPNRDDWSLAVRGKDGKAHRVHSTSHSGEVQEAKNIRLAEVYKLWEKTEQRWEEFMLDDAEYVVTAFGCAAGICKSVVKQLRGEGIKIGIIRPQVLFPFPNNAFEKLNYSKVKKIFSVEMSIPPQFGEDVASVVAKRTEIVPVLRSGGVIPTPDEIALKVKENL